MTEGRHAALLRLSRAHGRLLLQRGASLQQDPLQQVQARLEWQRKDRRTVEETLRNLEREPALADDLAELVEAGTTWLDQRVPHEAWKRALSLALAAPGLRDHPVREANLRIARAKCLLREGDLIAARAVDHEASLRFHERAVVAAGEAGDAWLRLESKSNLAMALGDARRYEESERLHLETIAEARAADYTEIVLRCQDALGVDYRLQGNTAAALASHTAQLAAARELGLPGITARALNGIGLTLEAQGRHEEALRHFDEALAIHRATGAVHEEMITTESRGISLKNLGRLDEAEASFAAALDYARRASERRAEGRRLNHLFNVAMQRDDREKAERLAAENVALARRSGDPAAIGVASFAQFTVLDREGRAEEADAALRLAVENLRAARYRQGLSTALNALGRRELGASRTSPARAAFEESLACAREIGNPWMISRDLLCLATCAGAAGAFREGLDHLALAEEALSSQAGPRAAALHAQIADLRHALQGDLEGAAPSAGDG
jgi:tetratricopeptide (TPR) repeat protein